MAAAVLACGGRPDARQKESSVVSFDDLVAEAVAAPFSGWDFGWLDARSRTEELPWRYADEVAARSGVAVSMLDQGTGGGELLATIVPRPARTVATESWPPNVPVAAGRLRPLGIPVVQCDGAPDNMTELAASPDKGRPGRLPFGDGTFDLVINRHESFRADEVFRVLAPGGTFLTQQVDYHSDDDLFRLLGLDPPSTPESWLPLAVSQLSTAGLSITHTATAQTKVFFDDIGAVVYYLKIVAWSIPEYRLEAFIPQLRTAWEARDAWPWPSAERRFLVVATKPALDGLALL
jgi:SAM-dependent methyltransferase